MNVCMRAKSMVSAAMVLAVLFVSGSAFAGQPAQTNLDRNLQTVFDKVISVLQGPLVLGVATIFFMGALLMMLMGAGGDGVQKLVKIVLVLAALLAVPGILNQLFTALGAVI